ncbi:DUF2306 domain-containing protein [Rhizobium sp. SSA_523]|uniref:DUF2306 domain-containing protein n=1 Tax=Rhizobium sp. SSA_523 TaxID=2952477 RepID=UPI00209135E4|nr:DUF2306 domain-containing protein [Rhizobium sp. SSA_523]MCO5730368.1 DUF2306 domain-containing protein [Rhizobium sp. SSA_523]WKC25412.1 DUF2306 domain-containing protein [Rhizobium sp. SSA_523]
MTLEPLFTAPLAVQIHVATVLPAAAIGAFLLIWRGRGTPLHRLLGRVWIGLMISTALSSFFIHELNVWRGFSPIHILSLTTIAGCLRAVQLARTGRIAAHKRMVATIYLGGIVIAGGFTLLPYRLMHQVVFEGALPMSPLLLLVALILPCLLFYLIRKQVSDPGSPRRP